MLTRRELLSRTILASGAGLTLWGCATANQVASTVAQDASLIATGLKGALANLGALNIPGLTADKVMTIGLAVAGLQTVATSLLMATTTAVAQPLVQQIETDLNAIVGALAGLPLPPPISTALQAAAILLPVIETAIGMVLPPTAPATPAARLAASVTMTADQARLILKGFAR